MAWFRNPSLRPLLDAPGPSPWYLYRNVIRTPIGVFRWNAMEAGGSGAGVNFLTNPAGEVILLADFYCYTKPLSGQQMLVWYPARQSIDGVATPVTQFEILDLSALTPISDYRGAAEEVRSLFQRIRYEGAPTAHFAYPRHVEPGKHSLGELPGGFTSLGEILVLASYDDRPRPAIESPRPSLAIFAFDFPSVTVIVIPQDWFNLGDYDFGYQWVTRVARDPATGRIFGEGIRLGLFRSDESGRNVEEWLVRDDFYRGLESPARRSIVSLLRRIGGRLVRW